MVDDEKIDITSTVIDEDAPLEDDVVLKKDDMIRKNVVESILAERDILICVHNPFVLTYFELSKVGLINSTYDLSGPTVSLGDNNSHSLSGSQQERCKNRSAASTPDSSGNWIGFVDKFSNLVKFASIAFQLLLT
ncbi:hypothetical protein Hanom_Chr16g01477711 [Helianthus anomalus]